MTVTDIPIAELLPHSPPMVLLDRVVLYEDPRLVTGVTIRQGNPFCENGGVPGWIGIEYMAQSVAAHAGIQAHLRGDAPKIGFLLGTRKYECSVDRFPLQSNLEIVVEPLFVEPELGAFSCRIEMGRLVATATINVFQPEEAKLAEMILGQPSK